MQSISLTLTTGARKVANLISEELSQDNQTKIVNGDPVRFNIQLQAPAANAANVRYGNETEQSAFLTAGSSTPIFGKLNVQDLWVRGNAGDSVVVLIID
jgi:hypothetical protein